MTHLRLHLCNKAGLCFVAFISQKEYIQDLVMAAPLYHIYEIKSCKTLALNCSNHILNLLATREIKRWQAEQQV